MFFLNIFDVSLLPKEHHQNYWKFLQVNNICLKTDTILLQCTFYQFQYFIITCQHKEIYQRRSQSKGFNGNDLMVGWSRLINKLSLIRILNLFASEESESVFISDANRFRLLIKEHLLIKRDQPIRTKPSSHFR